MSNAPSQFVTTSMTLFNTWSPGKSRPNQFELEETTMRTDKEIKFSVLVHHGLSAALVVGGYRS